MHFVDAKGILTGSGGRYGMNIYRGCTHGCIYCDSRSSCYQFAHPFEDVEVKRNAPELLEAALRSKRKPCMISTGSMSDPYMHCEETLRLTRRCLEIILRYGFGAVVLTKSDRVLRDIDLLDEINRASKCVVQMTLTTADEELCRIVEPNVCTTKRRIEVLEELHRRGIPTVVWLSPVLPFINDTEENISALLSKCVRVGVKGIVCERDTDEWANKECFTTKLPMIHGADAARRGQGVLLRRTGQALPRAEAALYRALRECIFAAKPERKKAHCALPGHLRRSRNTAHARGLL